MYLVNIFVADEINVSFRILDNVRYLFEIVYHI